MSKSVKQMAAITDLNIAHYNQFLVNTNIVPDIYNRYSWL